MFYKELKSVDGKVVGHICVECGRLSTAPHPCRRATMNDKLQEQARELLAPFRAQVEEMTAKLLCSDTARQSVRKAALTRIEFLERDVAEALAKCANEALEQAAQQVECCPGERVITPESDVLWILPSDATKRIRALKAEPVPPCLCDGGAEDAYCATHGAHTEIQLCAKHAETWFCERNHLPNPTANCVLCAFANQPSEVGEPCVEFQLRRLLAGRPAGRAAPQREAAELHENQVEDILCGDVYDINDDVDATKLTAAINAALAAPAPKPCSRCGGTGYVPTLEQDGAFNRVVPGIKGLCPVCASPAQDVVEQVMSRHTDTKPIGVGVKQLTVLENCGCGKKAAYYTSGIVEGFSVRGFCPDCMLNVMKILVKG
jgi:hypothetical protein